MLQKHVSPRHRILGAINSPSCYTAIFEHGIKEIMLPTTMIFSEHIAQLSAESHSHFYVATLFRVLGTHNVKMLEGNKLAMNKLRKRVSVGATLCYELRKLLLTHPT